MIELILEVAVKLVGLLQEGPFCSGWDYHLGRNCDRERRGWEKLWGSTLTKMGTGCGSAVVSTN